MSYRRTDCYVCVTWLGGELCARATSSCSCFLESDDDTHLLGASYLKISFFFSDHARASLSGYLKCVCMSFPFTCIHCDARVLQWLHYLSCPHPNLLFVMVHVCLYTCMDHTDIQLIVSNASAISFSLCSCFSLFRPLYIQLAWNQQVKKREGTVKRSYCLFLSFTQFQNVVFTRED